VIVFRVAFVGAEPELCGAVVRVDIMKIDVDLEEDGEVEMMAVIITMDGLSACRPG
jgi:hypothetical protein